MMPIHPPHPDPEPMLEINTTPLIDVMLVLLVMLIITIPTAWQSTELSVAQGSSQKTSTPTIQVRIDAQGAWYWNGTPVQGREALVAKLQVAAKQQPAPALALQPDPKAPYAQVLAVLASAQQLGLTQLGIQAAPNANP